LPNSLPILLVVAWAFFFASLFGQARYEAALKGNPFLESPSFVKAIAISTLLGMLAGLGILGYFFYKVSWYWPIVLAVCGSLLGALVVGVLLTLVGEAALGRRGFFGWPLFGLWAIQIIHSIHSTAP